MSDPANGTVEPDRPPEPPAPAAAAAPFGLPAGAEVQAGFIWHDYAIEGPVPGHEHAWYASVPARDEKVVLWVRPLDDHTPARRTAWAQLTALQHAHLLRCIDAHEDEGWRYEVTARPSPMTLREWIACHQSGFHEIEAFVRQIAPMIGALHDKGVGHFNLSPESIHIEEIEGEPKFVIAGYQHTTTVDQPGLIPIEVDPFYAPPEAAGLAQHQPGVRLYAWDWWSLGRIVQEFLLGRHVLGLLLDRDVSRPTPELRQRAELLLLEREPAGARAGAVEHMSAEPASVVLLRGLLTGSCDARWTLDAVQRWLKREQVREYYDLPRTARLWIWQGRALTLPDAADHFTHAAHWPEGETVLFDTDRAESLATFLRDTPAYRDDWERLQAVREMTQSGGWQQLDPDTRRIIATAVGWLALSNGSGVRAAFRVYGQTIDSPGLAELLKHPGGAQGVALFNGLLFPAVVEYVETLDSTAGRVLKGLAAKAGTAVRTAVEHGWLDPQDVAESSRLQLLALERTVVLQDRHALLQHAYATSRDPELARILGEKTPAPFELVLSAFTGEAPDRYGYITHREWRHQRYLELKTEADQIAATLLWVRLRQLLGIARLWGAPWQVFVGVAAALAGLAGWLNRSVPVGALVAVLLLVGRLWLVVRARRQFQLCGDTSPHWLWTDGVERSRREAERMLARVNAAPAALAARLVVLRASMTQFGGWNKGPQVRPQWWDVAAVFALGLTVAAGAILHGLASRPALTIRPTPVANGAAAVPEVARKPVHVESADRTRPVAELPEALLATGRYEVIDDGFGRRLRGPLQPWPYFAPPKVAALQVEARARARPDQAAYAVVCGNLLLKPYVRSSVVGLLALRVPTTRGFGVVVFNSRERQLLDHEVILVGSTSSLRDRTWYELDHRRVLYLESPLPLDADISLAPW